MKLFLWGVSMSGAALAALSFARTWVQTRDRFFALFAAAFATLAVQWFMLALISSAESSPTHYLLRIAAFLMIVVAIVDKNRRP